MDWILNQDRTKMIKFDDIKSIRREELGGDYLIVCELCEDKNFLHTIARYHDKSQAERNMLIIALNHTVVPERCNCKKCNPQFIPIEPIKRKGFFRK